MSAPISIIIPTLNDAVRIGPTLAALTEGLHAGLIAELILCDGGSSDDIAEVAEAAGAELVTGPAGRGPQLIKGITAARGAWLLVLHADSCPEHGWPEAVRAHMADHPGKAGYFDLRFDVSGCAPRWVAGWANLRSRWFGLPYGDQGLLLSRALYDQTGGYRAIPLMEDVAFSRALKGLLRPLGHRIVTSAIRYQSQGWLRRGGRNLLTLLLYRLGRDPARLVEKYRR